MLSLQNEAITIGWDLLGHCRDFAEEAAYQEFRHANPILNRQWNPLNIGHGDLGIALVLSSAAELDPDGGWDIVAHRHISKTVAAYRAMPSLHIGLLAGVSSVAWCLRSLSREGERYRSAIGDIEKQLARRMADAIEALRHSDPVPIESFDMASGIAGAITYSMVCGGQALSKVAEQSMIVLADRVIGLGPAAFLTGPDQVSVVTKSLNPETARGYRDLGVAHGASGVLHVLGQAADRGLGGKRTTAAASLLAEQILEESFMSDGRTDVPYFVYPSSSSTEGRTRTKSPTRHAWCYGNLGVAVAFANSKFLSQTFPTASAQLLPQQNLERAGISSVGLCHGWAGALLLERYVRPDASHDIPLQGVLGLVQQEETFGFSEHIGGEKCPSSPGYLDESGGAAATLASLSRSADNQPLALRLMIGDWR